MMLQGLILSLACGCFVWRACMERRAGALIGFALICAAVAISAFRRLVFAPGQVLAQVSLDVVVCSVFFAGSIAVVVDDFNRRRKEPMVPGGGDSWRKTLGPLLLAASTLLLSGTLISAWDGSDFDSLNFAQVLSEMDHARNPAAAMERGRRMVAEFEERLRLLEFAGTPEQRAWARVTRENLDRSRGR